MKLALVLGLLGLCIGSFLNVVIHRLPQMMERGWKLESAELLGVEVDMPAPITTDPISAAVSVWAPPTIASPAAWTSPAPSAERRGPSRSGSVPTSSRTSTTDAAKLVNADAPWPIPRRSSSSTMKPAIVP